MQTYDRIPIRAALALSFAPALVWALAGASHGQSPGGSVASPGPFAQRSAARQTELVWDARAVEHLFNRAAFGATPAEVERWVLAGPQATVEYLFTGGQQGEPFRWEAQEPNRRALAGLSEEERRKAYTAARNADRNELRKLGAWWVGRMLNGIEPLRERMTLFWHGHFTSSIVSVRRGSLMHRQHQLLRKHALGNFGDLLLGVLDDPAMLQYLDNDQNTKDSPNENLAREVMELFSLGEGNYTETDVKQAARALTGYTLSPRGVQLAPRKHDRGVKTILGVRGRHDRESLVEILLAQEACPRHIARQLLAYFEGAAPSESRVDHYASLLFEQEYRLEPMLRALFVDPEFYSPDVVGAKILSPVDFVVGSAHRLGLDAEPGYLTVAAGELGQALFRPPNVKGWEGGMTWLTTSTMMQRGNVIGILLGLIDAEHLAEDDEAEMLMEEMGADMEGNQDDPDQGQSGAMMNRMLRVMGRARYEPQVDLRASFVNAGLTTDDEIAQALCDMLLAVEPPVETVALVRSVLAEERVALGLEDGELLRRMRRGETILRRLAHLILSLPAAQLG